MRRVRVWAVMAVVSALLASTAEATPFYQIDGSIADWNVSLQVFRQHHGEGSRTSFVQGSFVPDPVGTIEYVVEDYPLSDVRPRGGERYDYEAL